MVEVTNTAIGIAVLAVTALWFYSIIWRWWIRPLAYAVGAKQWAWVAIIAVGGFLAGLVYLHSQTRVLPMVGAAQGDTLVDHNHFYRVLKVGDGEVLALHLGEREVR